VAAGRVGDHRDGGAGDERKHAGRVRRPEPHEVGDVQQREVQRALGREQVTEWDDAVAHLDRGEAEEAVVVREVAARDERRKAQQDGDGGEHGGVDPPRPPVDGGARTLRRHRSRHPRKLPRHPRFTAARRGKFGGVPWCPPADLRFG
jgi:hypothetical protein